MVYQHRHKQKLQTCNPRHTCLLCVSVGRSVCLSLSVCLSVTVASFVSACNQRHDFLGFYLVDFQKSLPLKLWREKYG